MMFDDLDKKMRAFEKSVDQFHSDGAYLIARLDGRGFTKLTKETLNLERPFDDRFHAAMEKTCEHLMSTGIAVRLCYTQSDEISLLLDRDRPSYNLKSRKLLSVLAGEASGVFSLAVGHPVCFDCRICPMPGAGEVSNYFRWRAEDARRNALNAYCYWTLRRQGLSGGAVDQRLSGESLADKRSFLAGSGIDFDTEAIWKTSGAFLFWDVVRHTGQNPLTGRCVETTRNRLSWTDPTPVGDQIATLVRTVLG